ncbi:MAG TPA: TIGR03667 family PPOX class F420-dependent oxidoreductase [Thermomicrobiales bacterium]|jgi:PPOX class probable F420-dependent enzyme
MLDFTTEFGKRAAERLHTEEVLWLTTLGGDGTPQPSPVWFLWEDDAAIIYSQSKAPKVGNIARHPQVALSLNSDFGGGNVVILTGTAEIVADPAFATLPAAYTAKYANGLASLNMTPEAFVAEYSAVIRVTPTKLRGH